MEPEFTPELLAAWFNKGLYLIDEHDGPKAVKTSSLKKKYLVVSREQVASNTGLHSFLSGIIQACKISMDEVNVFTPASETDYRQLKEQFGASFIILFGIETSELDLPLVFPHFQLQSFNNSDWISSPDLTIIQNDKTMKTKLWNCLKQAFSL